MDVEDYALPAGGAVSGGDRTGPDLVELARQQNPRPRRRGSAHLVPPASDEWAPTANGRPLPQPRGRTDRPGMLERRGHFPIEEPGPSQPSSTVRALVEGRAPTG